jgi:hypothetical protein
VEREIAVGGCARLFPRHNTALGRRVVLPLMPPEPSATIDAARFVVRSGSRLA